MSSSKALLFLSVAFIVGVFCASFWRIPMWLVGELIGLGVLYSVLSGILWRREAVLVFGLCLIVFGLGLARTNQCLEVGPPNIGQSQNESNDSVVAGQGVLEKWRTKLSNVINVNFSEPQASILAGILVGEQKNISYEWKKKLNITGVRHITAVSGANIVLLAEMLVWLGLVIGLYRQKALGLAIILVWAYVIFIGYPASAVRAGIMGTLLLLSQVLGRQNAAERTIFLAAAVMLTINPLLLKNDWGFQLSFLATLGIVYLTPYFNNLFDKFVKKLIKLELLSRFINPSRFHLEGLMNGQGLKDRTSNLGQKLLEDRPPKVEQTMSIIELRQFLAMTLAAQIFTWPILVYNFGYLSLIAPLSNLLIFPVISLIMAFGFVFVLIGLLLPALAMVFSWPCQLLLNYLTLVIDLCFRAPFASAQFSFSTILLAISYAGLATWIYYLKKQKQFAFFGF